MAVEAPHNKIIRSIARAKLRPLGVQQKGRSRFWYDDRRWHAISIEFQAGFGRVSYLNVAISWLWYPKEFWSFDFPHLPRPRVEFHKEAQFEQEFEALADLAVKGICELRESFDSLQQAHKIFSEWHNDPPHPSGWPDVHLGLLSGLNDEFQRAEELLGFVAKAPTDFEWEIERKAFCEQALSCLGSAEDLRAWVEKNITECRRLLRMSPLDAPILPAN